MTSLWIKRLIPGTWLKRYMPTSLMGRATLILLIPILSLLLIVSFAFLQRHFDGVTRQLSRGVGLEIAMIRDRVEQDGDLTAETRRIAARLGLVASLQVAPDLAEGTQRRVYDISGRLIRDLLEGALEEPVALDLSSNWRRALIEISVAPGILRIDAPRERMSASNPHQLLVVMFAGGGLLTFISILFLRNQVRPIRNLARAAEEFGKGRALPFRPTGADEVRRAGHAFLAMRNRIERQIEQRTMMLSGVSHDLRTPLTRLKLGIATADGPEDLDALGDDIHDMERMLEEFLIFSRDATQDGPEKVDLNDLVRGVVDDAARGGHAVRFARDADATALAVRPVALKRAVQNLIDNACRYGSRADVRLVVTRKRVEIVVEDDGPGIPEASRERALRPFSRLDPARNQDQGSGTGLGLAIALDVARVHGGTLDLSKSLALGGLKATLHFPR